MAHHNRKVDEEMVQEILLDDPGFLRGIVERVVQELLEAQMTEHIGAVPTSEPRGAPGSVTAKAEDFENQGRYPQLAGAPG